MRQYVAYGKLITSANRRRSDEMFLDGWHGVSGGAVAVVGAVSRSVIH